MKYSFIIPVYNCEKYLGGCVNSILSADLRDYEIILVDDGSTDGSGALCDELAREYTQIKVFHQPNGGVSAARNRGIRESKGEYILFADSDDTFDSEMLSQVLSDPRYKQVDMTVFGLSVDYYYHGKCYRRDQIYYDFDGIMKKEQWGKAFIDLYRKNSLSTLCNKVLRRELLQEIELNTNMFLYEDLEFVLRYIQKCESVWNIPKAIYHYRQVEDEGNAGRRLKRIHSIPVFLQPIEAALENLRNTNLNIAREAVDSVLLRIHINLAALKVADSALPDIRRICRDFSQWHQQKNMRHPEGHEVLFSRLLHRKAGKLWLAAKVSSVRHKIAVWAKGNGIYKKHG